MMKMKCLTAVFMALVLFFMPFLVERAYAQVAEAQAQAKSDVSPILWLAIGCLLNVVGWVMAMLVTFTNPPVSSLLGKSPDYVTVYTDAYKAEAKRIQTGKALIGCLVGTGVEILATVLLVVLARSTNTFYY
jgi:hypothetical protein